MKTLLLVITIALISGCASTPVSLFHPITGEIVECGPYDSYASTELNESKCVDDYRAQGFKRFQPPTSSSVY